MLKTTINKYFFIAIILLFVSKESICNDANNQDTHKRYILEKIDHTIKSPDVPFLDLQDNKELLLENFEQKVILIYFWATWCTDCNNSMIELNKIAREMRKEPLKIITISEDFKDYSVIEEFFKKKKLDNLQIYIDKKGKLFNSMNLKNMPSSIIIDKKGNIIYKIIGTIDFQSENFKNILNNLIQVENNDER